MSANPATSLSYVDTVYSADSIEWCPHEGFQDIFICGTYQIIKPDPPTPVSKPVSETGNEDEDEDEVEHVSQPTQRVGRILMFQVGEDPSSLKEIQRIETAAILDTKWSPRLDHGKPVLGVADAKGCITIYTLDPDTRKLERRQRVEVADESILCLSLDFSHRLHPSEPSTIITSLSSGSLAYLTPSGDGGEYEVTNEWKAHDFEPWIVSFDNWDLNTVWSGGDDCKLKKWDLRDTSRPTLVNKNFEAGVTTITSSPHTPHLLAVGSYDENLRMFDSRSPLQPLTTIPLGGGIWRTRFHPSPDRKGDIMNACMHDNFKIVRLAESLVPSYTGSGAGVIEDSSQNLDQVAGPTWPASREAEGEVGGEVVRLFEKHDSLAYGGDWSRLPPRNSSPPGADEVGETLIATCSFYDHAMHLWRG